MRDTGAGRSDLAIDGLPGPVEASELRSRLDGLSSQHPSSPRYASDAPVWQSPDLAGQPDCPSPQDIDLAADRRAHILEGDLTGGGHRHGTGWPGKTEFPARWADDDVVAAVLSVARAPDDLPVRQHWNERWRVSGTRDAVEIVAIVTSGGQVWTAWPREGCPGVTRNEPAEG